MSEPKRVLQVVTHMDRGGLETMLMNYYRQTDRSRVQFDFLTHREGEKDYDAEIRALGGRIYHVPPVNPFSRNYLRALDVFFAEHPEYEVVHSHLDCMSAYVLRAAKKHGVPVRLAHSHNTNQPKNLKYLIKLWSKRKIAGKATGLFACGEDAGRWMFGGAEFRVLPNAIGAAAYRADELVRKEGRTELGVEDAVVLGHVGRFNEQKNHPFLIDLFAEAVKKEPRVRLVLVGDGEGRAAIEKKVQTLGLTDKVLFLGVRSDVPRLLQAMDVFVFPSLYEGLPVSLVEAQAAGLPCVISDRVPEESVLADGVERLPLGDAAYWADRVLRAAEKGKKDTYEAICAAGFDIAQNARWLEEFYLGAEA